MPVEQLKEFSQILATFNFQQEKAPFKENAGNPELLPAREDSIQLSPQAQKALNQKQPDASQAPEIASQPEAAMQIDEQGNRVRISSEGTELAASRTSKVAWETSSITESASSVETPKNIVGTATLDSGTKVSIYTTDFAEGEEKPFFDAPDKKVMAEITRVDGSTETLAIRANTVISEDASGNLIVNSSPEKYKTSERFEINGTSRNDVIINLNGASNIDCGEGDDMIISFNNIDNIYLGEGNNTVISDNQHSIAKIEAGNGNNSVIANKVYEIKVGNGNNTIYMNNQSRIDVGNGDNNINISVNDNEYNQSYLTLGDGNNIISFTGQYNFINELQAGNGNNIISIDGLVMKATIGDGNNTLNVGKGFDFSTTDSITGTIKNFPNAAGILSIYDTEINIGEGNNYLDFAVSYGNIQVGDGNNKFSTIKSILTSTLSFGDGNNEINSEVLRMHDLTFGNGNNIIKTKNTYGSNIVFGNGNNYLESDESYITKINTGNGDNYFKFGNLEGCFIHTGNGNDVIYVTGNIYGSTSMQTYIYLGGGDDALKVDGSVKGLMFFGGDGNDTVEIKGNVIDSQISTGDISANSESYVDRITIYKNIFNSFINSNSQLSKINIYGEVVDSTINNEKYKNTMRKSEQQSLHQLAEQELAEQRAKSFTWLVPNNDALRHGGNA